MKKFIFFIIICLPLLSLLTPGLPITHDGQDHVVRIANFYQSLSEGNVVPRWGSNLNWGFGHPVLMFLYPLPSYTASLFHFLSFSFVDSVKLVFALSYLLSIGAMYLFAREEWGSEAGIVAGLLYGFAPYRFVNLYVRGALGEHVAFIFLPLILWSISGIAKKKQRGLYLALSLAGLFLAHNAVSIMMLPVIVLYVVYLSHNLKEKRIFLIKLFLSGIYGVGLSAFFLLPAFFEGKYTLRDIVTKGEIVNRMVDIRSFIFSPWNYGGGNEFSKQLGFPAILAGIFGIIFVKEKKLKILFFGLLFLLGLYILLMTSPSLFIWNTVSLLQKFQFPWRLLVITTLLGSLLGGIVTHQLPKKFKSLTVGFFVLLILLTTFQMWKPKTYRMYDESFFTDIYKGTTDTGESSPIWSVRFMEFQPEVPMEVSEGNAKITLTSHNTTIRNYTVTAEEKTRLVENTLYFPGWKIFVDGQEVPVEFQDPQWRGRMTFWVEKGEHRIQVLFGETKLRKIANIVSLLSIIMLIPIFYFTKK